MDLVSLALVLTVLLLSGQNVVKKEYQQRSNSGICFFSAMVSFFAMLVFAIINRNWSFDVRLLLPAFGFGVSYALGTVGFMAAVRYGSLATSSLVVSYSLLIPTAYGLLFLREPIGGTLIVGLVLIALSLWLSNGRGAGGRVTWKWVGFIFLSFLGNGICSAVQKSATLSFGEDCMDLIMVIALGIATVLMLLSSLLMREREIVSVTLKKGWYLALLCGLMNGVTNVCVIFLDGRMDASVMFPMMSAGKLLIVFLYARLLLREKLSKKQYVGFFAGVLSIVVLSL